MSLEGFLFFLICYSSFLLKKVKTRNGYSGDKTFYLKSSHCRVVTFREKEKTEMQCLGLILAPTQEKTYLILTCGQLSGSWELICLYPLLVSQMFLSWGRQLELLRPQRNWAELVSIPPISLSQKASNWLWRSIPLSINRFNIIYIHVTA